MNHVCIIVIIIPSVTAKTDSRRKRARLASALPPWNRMEQVETGDSSSSISTLPTCFRSSRAD